MVATDSASSVPPHIHPPIAQVPIATDETLSEVPGISVSASFILTSISRDRRRGVESGFLLGDASKRSPVEITVTAGDTSDQPVPKHADGWHRSPCFLCFSQSQTHVLEH